MGQRDVDVEGVGPPGNGFTRVIRSLDRLQQKSPFAGFVVGVFKKYGDDRGGQLAALVTFSAYLAFFPLMLVVLTGTALLARAHPSLAERIRTSTIAQFPVVGTELTTGERALPGSGLGLGLSVLGLLWSGFGVTQSLQYVFHEVWHVPHKSRPPIVLRFLRGFALFGLVALGLLASTMLGLLGTFIHNSRALGVVGLIGAFAIGVALYMVVFWLLSPRRAGLVELLPGALVASLGWQILQFTGFRLVSRQLRRSSELYGAIGAGLGLLAFLYLGAQVLLYSLELTVVRKQRLWPRSILQPPLTDADIELLKLMALQEERRPEEHVAVAFDDEAATGPF